MLSALLQIRFFLCVAPLNLCRNEQSSTNTNMFTKSELDLPARRKKIEQILHKGILRSHLSSFSECHFTLQLAKNCAAGIRAAENQIEIEKSGNSEDNNENIISGSGNGNSNDNGHGNNVADDEGPEHNHEELTGAEWWWWWKWQQARHCREDRDNNVSDLWPVDTAVQVVASEVKGTIEPAVRAIVLGPIRQHVSMQGLVLLLVFGVFVISCVQMFAGLAMVSTGVTLAGVASLVLALMWRPRPSQSQSSNGDGDNDHDD